MSDTESDVAANDSSDRRGEFLFDPINTTMMGRHGLENYELRYEYLY